jgi:HPt (histidine-containing phosphotransfer) domain-containing protein
MDFPSPLVDWEQIDMLADTFGEEFVMIYGEFLVEIPRLFESWTEAFSGGDPVAVAKIAHQAKGAAANFGFAGLASVSNTAEMEAKAGSLEQASALLQMAVSVFEKTSAEVREKKGY